MGEMGRCRACGGPLPAYSGRGRPPTYCGVPCRRRAERRLRAARVQAAQPSGGYGALLAALGMTRLPTAAQLGAVDPEELGAVELDVDRENARMR
jgi:hypothetical protein